MTQVELNKEEMYCKVCKVDVENNIHYMSVGYACV